METIEAVETTLVIQVISVKKRKKPRDLDADLERFERRLAARNGPFKTIQEAERLIVGNVSVTVSQ